jgi:hypothetical protein
MSSNATSNLALRVFGVLRKGPSAFDMKHLLKKQIFEAEQREFENFLLLKK